MARLWSNFRRALGRLAVAGTAVAGAPLVSAGEGAPMTKDEWLACPDPGLLLHAARPRAEDRALRLFACVCVREIEHRLKDDRSRRAVTAAEQFAEGAADRAALEAAARGAERATQDDPRTAHFAALATAKADAWTAAWDASWEAALVAGPGDAFNPVRERQASLLRAVLEPPTPPSLDPAWRTWNDGCLVKMARTIRDERRYSDLPILADALQDAGCNDEALLACRVNAPALRGCWVVDLLATEERGTP
jgi:hypothetical protein